MSDAFIYDHVRTPLGRGKADGALHRVTPIQLSVQTLTALRERNHLDTALLDDVVLSCVSPVGEQGSDIARIAALVAGFDERVPGKQLNHFCASGLVLVSEFMKPLALSSYRFAKVLKVSIPTVNEIVRKRRAVTAGMALGLSRYFGTTPQQWLSLRGNTIWDLHAVRQESR